MRIMDEATYSGTSTQRTQNAGKIETKPFAKHKQAEKRRRDKISGRLLALREVVPHDARSCTATFLEGVISYIQSLQHTNAQLEGQLAALRALRTASGQQHASMTTQQELLVPQPAGSRSTPANSQDQPPAYNPPALQPQHHQQQQHQQQHHQHEYGGSSWRQEGVSQLSRHSPEAAATAAALAAAAAMSAGMASTWPQASSAAAAAAAAAGAPAPLDAEADAMQWAAYSHHQHHYQQQQQQQQPGSTAGGTSPTQYQLGSQSVPLHHVAAAAAAEAPLPAVAALSAPAALMEHTLTHTSTAAAAAAAVAEPGGGPGAGAGGPSVSAGEVPPAAAAAAGGAVAASGAAASSLAALPPPPAPGQLQLQGVLEQALLAALRQQAQQMVDQLINRGA